MLALLLAAAVAAPADQPIGRWRTETRNAIVEIDRCGQALCGRLITSDGIRANPELTDSKNKDAALRGRKLAGIEMLNGFTRDGDRWTGGKVYNPNDGGTYSGTLIPVDADHLRLKGCIIWPLCKTETWTRAH